MKIRHRKLFPLQDDNDGDLRIDDDINGNIREQEDVLHQRHNQKHTAMEKTSPKKQAEDRSAEKQVLLPSTSGRRMGEKLGLFTLTGAIIVFFQVTCEVGKSMSNYSIQYYNGGHYPIPQTVIVVSVEAIKLVVILVRSGCRPPSFRADNLRHSFKFLLPSVLYAVNNNIYFAGLTIVTPPIWLILCSFRTVVTATLYKFILKREITKMQFVGTLCIVFSIVVAKLGDIIGTNVGPTIPPIAFVLATIASCNSVGAAVYTESLFKKEGENFLEQQFWLYFYGIFVAAAVHVISFTNMSLVGLTGNIAEAGTTVQVLLGSALFFGGIGGLVVAAILKRLDNIVKEYSSATANIFTALMCSFLFPEKFQLTVYIMLAMCLLFAGIYLYETNKASPSKPNKPKQTRAEDSKVPLLATET